MNTPTETETLLGGVELSVSRIVPPATPGDKPQLVQETVFVRQLPVKTYPQLSKLQGADAEAGILELYCGQPAGWADTLVPKSYLDVIEAGEAQNACFFVWAERRLQRLEKEQPGMLKALMERAVEMQTNPNASPSARTAPRPRPV